MRRSFCGWLLIGSVAFGASGCATKTQTGALVGAASGAAIGGTIGSFSHSRAGEGALIGAGVGAIAGGLIGHGMDESDRKAERERQREYAEYSARRAAPPRTPAPRNDAAYHNANTITKRDVVKWSNRGTSEDVIIDRIERSGTVFHLSRADEQDLRDAGVSEMVIQEMRATARR